MKRKNKPGAGRPRYRPTDRDRDRVRIMAAIGIPHDQIAVCVGDAGISKPTLEKYYRRELDTSHDMAVAAVAARVYQKAVNSDNPAWALFYLKTQGGWRETHNLQHTGKDGAPLLTLADIDRIVRGDTTPE